MSRLFLYFVKASEKKFQRKKERKKEGGGIFVDVRKIFPRFPFTWSSSEPEKRIIFFSKFFVFIRSGWYLKLEEEEAINVDAEIIPNLKSTIYLVHLARDKGDKSEAMPLNESKQKGIKVDAA